MRMNARYEKGRDREEDRSAFARCLQQDYSRVNESLDNGHSGLGELLLGVSTGGVGYMSVKSRE